jgi:hypothetical protein
MTDASYVVLSAFSVAAGGSLTYEWEFFDTSTNPVAITDPSGIISIGIDTGTLLVDGAPLNVIVLSETTTPSLFVDASGNIRQRASTLLDPMHPLVTGQVYNGSLTGYFRDGTQLSSQVTSKVLSAPDFIPRGTFTPGDDHVRLVLDPSSAAQFVLSCANVTSDGSLDYTGMNIIVKYNDGSYNTGFQTLVTPYTSYLSQGYVQIAAVNGVRVEYYIQLQSNLGLGPTSQGAVATSTDRPNAPQDLTAVSNFEFSRDVSGQSIYTVPSSLGVTLLWNDADVDVSATHFEIFKQDLSSNSYTPTSAFTYVGRKNFDASGVYNYISSDDSPYSYQFVDPSVAIGRYYGYKVNAVNANGAGLFTNDVGVRVGIRSNAPAVALAAQDTAVRITPTAPTLTGGFDLSAGFYYINYLDSSSGITTYTTRTTDASGIITVTGLTNGVSYTFSVYAATTNNDYTTPGTDVSSNNTGDTLVYLSAAATPPSIIPYATPSAPAAPTVRVLDASGNPTGQVAISWVPDLSFNGYPLGYIVTRLDVSGNSTIIATLPPANPMLNTPVPQARYTDGNVTLGSTYYYTVQYYYIVNSNPVPSLPSPQSAAAVPFLDPASPAGFNPLSVNGVVVTFGITPANLSYPQNSGGLLPIRYNAIISDPSGVAPPVSFLDISANTTYTSGNLTPNVAYRLTAYAYVVYNNQNFFSDPVSVPLPLTSAFPQIVSADISGGILRILTQNFGSKLNFAEGLILDSSNVLLVSVNVTSPLVTDGFMTVVSNTNAGSQLLVNFNDPQVQTGNGRLVVVANSQGAAVVNSL